MSATASAAMPAVRAGSNLHRHPHNAKKQSRSSVIRRASPTKTKTIEAPPHLERLRILTPWEEAQPVLKSEFGMSDAEIAEAGALSDEEISEAYTMMQLCRDFENECNQAYMQGHIRGFMHLDNGQETIPALIADSIKQGDIKYSYYREHTHAIASGVDSGAVMAELFAKDTGTCRGTGGSMHIYDVETNFQGGWALVAEQLPYAVGAARSIALDKHLGTGEAEDRIAVVFVGEGGAQNGRMAECLNAAAKENLPILFIVIDNGRAINTFTKDVATNQEVFNQGKHYGIPGVLADGQNVQDTMRIGRAAIQHVRTKGPAILQVHTFRFNGHSPADPEHERNRKDEKRWARAACDPIKIFEESADAARVDLAACTAKAKEEVRKALEFANASPPPPKDLAAQLEYPDPTGSVDYSKREPVMGLAAAEEITKRIVPEATLTALKARIEALRARPQRGWHLHRRRQPRHPRGDAQGSHHEGARGGPSGGVHPTTCRRTPSRRSAPCAGRDHRRGPLHRQGARRGHERLPPHRRAHERQLWHRHRGAVLRGQHLRHHRRPEMPMTIIKRRHRPEPVLGAEHSQPFHAYIMGIPGLKICTASKPHEAYGLAKSMIRDNSPGVLLLSVKLMKTRGAQGGQLPPLHKATVHWHASQAAIDAGKRHRPHLPRGTRG